MHNLLLNNTHVSRFPKAFSNYFSANIKLSEIQLHNRTIRRTVGRILGPLLKIGLSLMKNVLKK